jgi:hypothetical protein
MDEIHFGNGVEGALSTAYPDIETPKVEPSSMNSGNGSSLFTEVLIDGQLPCSGFYSHIFPIFL